MKLMPIPTLVMLLFGLASAAPAATTTSQPTDIVVHINDFAFKPATLRVHPGQTVLFVNDDDEAHTVTAKDKLFDSGGLDTRQSWSHRFTRPGTYAYFCVLHPYMKGSVIVDAAAK